jgi:hypothetical protein
VIPNVVYVNKLDFLAQRMKSSFVKYAVRYFLMLVYHQNALVLCTRSGKKRDSNPPPPKLSPEGFEAIHGEFQYGVNGLIFYLGVRVKKRLIFSNLDAKNDLNLPT